MTISIIPDPYLGIGLLLGAQTRVAAAADFARDAGSIEFFADLGYFGTISGEEEQLHNKYFVFLA